ncbi:MAG: hypothetical protein MZV70_44515 [Desulfobacterales bacterium]|nr:hypothetical protein [Desulfobacterales bacterium]
MRVLAGRIRNNQKLIAPDGRGDRQDPLAAHRRGRSEGSDRRSGDRRSHRRCHGRKAAGRGGHTVRRHPGVGDQEPAGLRPEHG